MKIRPLPDWRHVSAVACLASGPSLNAGDIARVKAAGLPCIVTNTTFRSAPWADALFAFDFEWWKVYHDEVRATFAGRRFCESAKWPTVDIENAGVHPGYHAFGNSGACAVSLAIAAGARRVILLGYDGRKVDGRTHHHGDHPAPLRNCNTMPMWAMHFERLARWARLRAEVLNATPDSAIRCFSRVKLDEVLEQRCEA